MRPGQLTPNELEAEVLGVIAKTDQALEQAVDQLHVLSRTYTGVGSFTTFACSSDEPQRDISLGKHIQIPGLSHGLGAVLFLKGNEPCTLEIYAYGENWDGTIEGYALKDAA